MYFVFYCQGLKTQVHHEKITEAQSTKNKLLRLLLLQLRVASPKVLAGN